MATTPTTIPELLLALRSQNATAPRLTWYGPDSERVELSGRVLDLWVAKTANFIVDELDAEPGTAVAVDMPVHWRSLVWLLATWAVGATALSRPCQSSSDDAADANIVATTDPEAALSRAGAAGRAPFVVAVALPALAMRWLGELPADVLDYSGDVRAHADVFFADETPGTEAVAWESGAGATPYGSLVPAPAADAAPRRVLLQAQHGWD
ncbi:MAG: TIGR03089 family protein, partial [Specibacter sp.]